jgi:hypothetical protein
MINRGISGIKMNFPQEKLTCRLTVLLMTLLSLNGCENHVQEASTNSFFFLLLLVVRLNTRELLKRKKIRNCHATKCAMFKKCRSEPAASFI